MCRAIFDGKTYNIAEHLPTSHQCFFWIDYFSLRQAQAADFNLDAILLLISKIDTLIGQLDYGRHLEYLSRSFCIFELYAAISGSTKVLLYCPGTREQYEDWFR